MARVRITKTPKALSGLEVKMKDMKSGLYGTNGNRQFSLPNQIQSSRFSEPLTEVRNTLQPVAREDANLEAEKDETAILNMGGMPAHFKIGGKRHSQGGTPLNLPDNSFIYSDTAKMKIKDLIIQAQFGMVPKKSGYTPAEISKKYDINKFRKILADKNSEPVERKTAEMMISNYNLKLAKLALIQESMKGFPQGIPLVAMPYIIENELDASQFLPDQAQEQLEGAEQPDADTGEARYGANVISQWDTHRYGGIPKAQKGLQKSSLSRKELENMQRTILGQIEKLRSNNIELPTQLSNAYEEVEKSLNQLGPDKTTREPLTNDNSVWVNTEGTTFDPVTGEEIDPNELNYFDPSGVSKYFGKIGKYWGNDIWQGNPNDIALPPASGYGEAPTANALAAKKMISKLNPYNVPSDGVMGAFDYAGNLLNLPLSGVNKMLTGKVGTTDNLYTDVAFDPLTYVGLSPAKWAAQAAIKYGPKVGTFVLKYGDEAVKFIQKYGEKGIDWIVANTPKFIEGTKKVLTSKGAQNLGTSLISRGASGYALEKEKKEKIKKLEQEVAALREQVKENPKQDATKVIVPPAAKKDSLLIKEKPKTETKKAEEVTKPKAEENNTDLNWD